MKSTKDVLQVEALRTGDKFAFLDQSSGEAAAAMMVVTRSPAVNRVANSCHFRYQPQSGAGSTVATNGWKDNQSWNGAPGVLVRLLDRLAVDPPASAPSDVVAAPRKRK